MKKRAGLQGQVVDHLEKGGAAGGRQRGDGMDVIQSTLHTRMKIRSQKLKTPSVRTHLLKH